MRVLSDPASIAELEDPELRALLERRVQAILAEGYQLDELALYVVVEPGDPIETINAPLGFSVLCTRWEPDACFGTPAFEPSWELLWEHAGYYEILYVMSDDGFGVGVFVPKAPCVAPELLAMCAAYAIRAEESDS